MDQIHHFSNPVANEFHSCDVLQGELEEKHSHNQTLPSIPSTTFVIMRQSCLTDALSCCREIETTY